MTAESYSSRFNDSSQLTPGFYVSLKNRSLMINKFEEYVRERSVIIRSRRLLEEMKVFVWKGDRQEAQNGYNDDLLMSFAMGMYLRDTSFRFKKENDQLNRLALEHLGKSGYNGAYTSKMNHNPYMMNVRGENHDFSWLIKKKK